MENEEELNLKILFEQYKLYVEMADRISQRRAQTNQFYITVLSALFVILSLIVSNGLYQNLLYIIVSVIAGIGIILCIVWFKNIKSYKQLTSGKFLVIHQMEEKLPFDAYKKEWEILGKGEKWDVYFPLTNLEKFLPLIMAGLYGFIILLSIIGIYSGLSNC